MAKTYFRATGLCYGADAEQLIARIDTEGKVMTSPLEVQALPIETPPRHS